MHVPRVRLCCMARAALSGVGWCSPTPVPQRVARIECIAQSVPEQIGAEDEDHDRQPWHRRYPPGRVQVTTTVGEHATQRWHWWLDAEAQEAECGFEDDGATELQGRDDDDRT